MVNNTVNGKRIGRGSGYRNNTYIKVTSIYQSEKDKELKAIGKEDISVGTAIALLKEGQYVSLKAYNGGNPNKQLATSRKDEGQEVGE